MKNGYKSVTYFLIYFLYSAILLTLISCDKSQNVQKNWVRTIDNKYTIWGIDSLQYSWEGSSFEEYIHGNGTLSIFSGSTLIEKKVFEDDNRAFFGTFDEDDIHNVDDDQYVGEIKDNTFNGVGILIKESGDIYSGQFLNGKPDGELTFYKNNKLCYTGSWKNGKWNGYGTHYLDNGEAKQALWENGQISQKEKSKLSFANGEYNGYIKNGSPDGHGTMFFKDNSSYKGFWEKGLFSGEGVWASSRGDTVSGEWKKGRITGYAEMISSSGNYYGGWVDNKFEGNGVYTFPDSTIYSGKWKAGKLNGSCEILFQNNDSYIGDISNGKFNGVGLYIYKNGDTYLGDWKDNYQHGTGTYKTNAIEFSGDFDHGQISGYGEILFKDRGDSYKGYFENNLKSGIGSYYFKNGNRYEGEFKNDLFNGNGIFTFADGNQYQGEFYNGKMYGKGSLYLQEGDSTVIITAVWDGTNNFPSEASILFPNGDIYEGPLANGFPTNKGNWSTDAERKKDGKKKLDNNSLLSRANKFYKRHQATLNKVADITSYVEMAAIGLTTIPPLAPFAAPVALVLAGAYSTIQGANAISAGIDTYVAYQIGDTEKTKEKLSEVGENLVYAGLSLVAPVAVAKGAKAVKPIAKKVLTPLLKKGKVYGKQIVVKFSNAKNNIVDKYKKTKKNIVEKYEMTKARYKIKPEDQFSTTGESLRIFKDKKNKMGLVFGKGKDSKTLSENMKKVGKEEITGTAAHHIIGVEKGCPSSIALLKILEHFDIDVNSPINGIRLPGSHQWEKKKDNTHSYIKTSARGQIHSGSHSCKYYDQVLEIVESSETPEKFIQNLTKVKKKIFKGDIILNITKKRNTIFGTKDIK